MRAWRDKEPTCWQLEKLKKLGAAETSELTRGEVSDRIDELLAPAKKRTAERHAKAAARAAKIAEKSRLEALERFAGGTASDDDLITVASSFGFTLYGSHYLYPSGWMLQVPEPGLECGNCASTSMTSACWCGWKTVACGVDDIRAYLARHEMALNSNLGGLCDA